jgi:DNA-directed RNA polymerase subunit M/transcription elongation factor TFIIS
MITRVVDDANFRPHAVWTVSIQATCPQCQQQLSVADAEKKLSCTACGYECPLEKSVDDVADDVLMHVKGNKHMKVDRIRQLAEIETQVAKEEAGEAT